MSDKPVIVYGASGYTGRLICEYLREYNVPFVAAGRDAGKVTSSMSTNVAGIETAAVRRRRDRPRRGLPDRAVQGRLGRVQHRRPVRQVRPRGGRGLPGRRGALPRHHRRAGLADHLRRAVRRRLRLGRAAARPGRRADVHHRRDRRPAVPGEARSRHPRHRGLLGRQPDHRVHPDDPGQRRARRGALPRAEHLPALGPRGRPLLARRSPASTSSRWRCPGAGPRTRCGSARTRGSPT